VVPALGANATHFRVWHQGALVDLLLPPPDLAALRASPYRAGNPILFPFPNRIREARFTFQGRTYHLQPSSGPHAIHGLVSGKPFQVLEARAGPAGAELRLALHLEDFPDIQEQYPFPCRLSITYRLAGETLTLEAEAENTGRGPLPLGFGVHPWFPATFGPGGRREEGIVRLPARRYWELEGLLPTGRRPEATGRYDLRAGRLLGDESYDDVFTDLIREDGWSEGSYEDPAAGLAVVVQADASFREWVLYAPLDRPVVCLEPYTCPTDAFNLAARGIAEHGMVVLMPGRHWRGTVRFTVRRQAGAAG